MCKNQTIGLLPCALYTPKIITRSLHIWVSSRILLLHIIHSYCSTNPSPDPSKKNYQDQCRWKVRCRRNLATYPASLLATLIWNQDSLDRANISLAISKISNWFWLGLCDFKSTLYDFKSSWRGFQFHFSGSKWNEGYLCTGTKRRNHGFPYHNGKRRRSSCFCGRLAGRVLLCADSE